MRIMEGQTQKGFFPPSSLRSCLFFPMIFSLEVNSSSNSINMIEHLINLFQQHALTGYIILFFSMLAEATLTLLAVGALLAQKLINVYLAVGIMVVGALVEQIIFYYIGHNLKRSEKILEWTNKFAKGFDQRLVAHPRKVIFISKFVYGLHRTTLIRAGMVNMGFKNFVKACIPATLAWVAVVGGLGYFLSASYQVINKYMQYAEIVPFVIVVLFFGAEYMFTRRFKREV